MNRRSIIQGLLALLAGSLYALPVAADPVFMVNEWTAGKPMPNMVRRSEIRECRHIQFFEMDGSPDLDGSWVNVVLHDGRVISTELGRFQDVQALVRALKGAGVPFKTDTFQAIAAPVGGHHVVR